MITEQPLLSHTKVNIKHIMENRPPPKPRRLRGTAANALGNKYAFVILGVTTVVGLGIQ